MTTAVHAIGPATESCTTTSIACSFCSTCSIRSSPRCGLAASQRAGQSAEETGLSAGRVGFAIRGPHDERAVLERTIEADRTYVMDRGYAKFSLFNQIVAAGSSYVCRVRDNSVYEVLEERPLTDADRALNVLGDQIVALGMHEQGGGAARSSDPPDYRSHQSAHQPRQIPRRLDGPRQRRHPADRHQFARRAGRGHRPDLTSHRWTIEIFFRFFKHVLGCRHLLSHSQQGIEIQTYCAIIACMLISLWTGRKPTLRTYEMICYYFTGLASEDELLAHLAKLKPTTRHRKKSEPDLPGRLSPRGASRLTLRSEDALRLTNLR